MFSVKQKIFITFLLTSCLFLGLLLFSVPYLIQSITYKAMRNNSKELIRILETAKTEDQLIQKLKDEKYNIFFRVGIINSKRQVLYDTHMKRLFGKNFQTGFPIYHPEVEDAFKNGIGYSESESSLLKQPFIYVTTAFQMGKETYVLRAAFPSEHMGEISKNFEVGFLALGFLFLLLFSSLTWFFIKKFIQPIQEISEQIALYNQGKIDLISSIELSTSNKKNEFYILAMTLNKLSKKIKEHITLLTNEKNEKEALLEMKKTFVANASHELKTPITIILGYAETLSEEKNLPSSLKEEMVAKILKNSHRLDRIVKDLLVLSDIETLPLSRVSKVNLLDLLNSLQGEIKEKHKNALLYFSLPSFIPLVEGDSSLLELAFFNLLDNSCKYCNTIPEIHISFHQSESAISVILKDNGIGMADMELTHIFERFFRINKKETQKKGGSGLGLSIVKMILEKHFGTITVSSTLEQGSSFTVTLPKKH